MNADVQVSNDRHIEVLANGFALWHGSQQAVVVTMVSPVAQTSLFGFLETRARGGKGRGQVAATSSPTFFISTWVDASSKSEGVEATHQHAIKHNTQNVEKPEVILGQLCFVLGHKAFEFCSRISAGH